MTNAWKVLGLKRGADKAAIRRAYAQRLKSLNAEDDPQGFMELREAYESLLAQLAWAAVEEQFDQDIVADPDTEVGKDGKAPETELVEPGDTAIATDPDEANLDQLLRELSHHLETNGSDRMRSKALLEEVIDSPALAVFTVRDRAELLLAHMILDNLPHSDAIVLRAVKAFGWSDPRHSQRFPFSAAVGRLDEWRTIQSLETFGDPLNRAWLALTRPPNRLVRWWFARSARRDQIAELIDHSEYVEPGLCYSMDSAEVAWWEQELLGTRVPLDAIAWRVASGLLLGGALAISKVPMGLATGVALAALFCLDFVAMRRFFAGAGRIQAPFHWRVAVVTAILAMPLAALFVQPSWFSAAAVAVVAVGLAWTARVAFAQPTGVDRSRLYLTAVGVTVLAFVFLTVGGVVPAPEILMVVAVAWLLATQLPLLRPWAASVLDDLTRNLTWPVLAFYGAGICYVAWAIRPAEQTPLVSNAFAVCAVYAAGGIAAFAQRPIPSLILRASVVIANLALVFGAGASSYEPVEIGSGAGTAIVAAHVYGEAAKGDFAVREAAEALASMSRGNPALEQKIRAELQLIDGRTQVGPAAAQKIDALLNREVERLLPMTSNALIARHERLKAAIVSDWLAQHPDLCRQPGIIVDDRLSPDVRSTARSLFLDIAAAGPAEAAARRDVALPPVKQFDAVLAAARKDLANRQSRTIARIEDVEKCRTRLATLVASSGLSDDQIGTLARLARRP